MLIARDVTKEYMSGEQKLVVLRDVSFTIKQGAFVAIVGPSGSGKTTLLGLLAGLDTPTRGTVVLDDADLGGLSENDRARLRGEKVGFVFQTFQLIPTLTALENVQVPLELRGTAGATERARGLIGRGRLTGGSHPHRRRLLLYMSSIAAGVAALVAIDSFSANVTQSVKGQSRAIMGGGVSFSSSKPIRAPVDSLFASLSHKGFSFARATTFPS